MEPNYNPNDRPDNCGFCSISRAIYKKSDGGRFLDSNALYVQTLANLHIEPAANGADPISRMLLLPERDLHNIAIPESHKALRAPLRSAADYMVASVANSFELPCINDVNMVKGLHEFIDLSRHETGPRRFRSLAEERLERRLDAPAPLRQKLPSLGQLEQHLRNEFAGQFIVGIHRDGRLNHFINLSIDLSGRIEAFDAQIRKEFDPQLLGPTNQIRAVTRIR